MSLLVRRRDRRAERAVGEPTGANIDLLEGTGTGGENEFAEGVDAGHRIDPRAQKIYVIAVVLVAVYVAGCILPTSIFNVGYQGNAVDAGTRGYALTTFLGDLGENVTRLLAMLSGGEFYDPVFRLVVVALAGMGLALSGAVYQGTFKNALVSPSTLGVMTGGNFGMVVWVVVMANLVYFPTGGIISNKRFDTVFGAEDPTWVDYLNNGLGLSLFSFAGCLFVVVLVLLTLRAAGNKRTSGIMMILTGQVVSAVLGAFAGLVTYYFATTDAYLAEVLREMQVASFYRDYSAFEPICLFAVIFVTFAVVYRLSGRMMVLSLDEAEQRAVGVDTRRMRGIVVGLCTFLTAVVISFCGSIGFVGFIVPHLARRLVGPDFKYLLPASAVLGGVFVLAAFVILNTLLGADYAQLTGLFISLGGAFVFLFTVIRGKGAAYGAFK